VNAPLHVEVRGRGPDLVLLHGWALHGGMWGPWLDRLAGHATLHLIDLPGHGRSGAATVEPSLGQWAAAVAQAVPAGGTVLGWSLGGLVALELARTHPSHVAALVLVATTPCFVARDDWAQGMRREVLEEFASGLAGDYRRTISNFLALQTWGDEHATQALRHLRASIAAHGEPDPRTLAAGLEILRHVDVRDTLGRIAVPTLVLAGERDRITPAAAGRRLAESMPAARFVEFPRAGHAPFLSHPGAVAQEVERFLARHGAGVDQGFAHVSAAGSDRDTSGSSRPVPTRSNTPATLDEDAFTLDVRRVRESFSQAAARYDAASVLQARVRGELLDRLDLLRMQPQVVVDLGAGTGHAAIALKRRYPKAQVLAVDLAVGMLQQAARRQTLLRRFHRVAADAATVPMRDASTDMLFSNLMLQWVNDADRVLRECWRVLRPGGVLHLTTLGPDTLGELRRAWQAADPAHAHVNGFLDMHDLGDALVRAGFAEPVLDVERYTLTYDDVRGLMRDLKAIGAHNATAGRARGLTGKATLARMIAAYEADRQGGKLPATYEVVFAQAWRSEAPPRAKRSPPGAPVMVPISEIGRRRDR
jgi:malonyl-CoA O-methyltransferase